MKNNVFVPSICPGMPWDSRPISFPDDFPHTSLYRGLIRRWQYSIISPVSPSNTAPAISYNNFIGNFWDAKFLGVAGVSISSIHGSMNSWVSVLFWIWFFFLQECRHQFLRYYLALADTGAVFSLLFLVWVHLWQCRRCNNHLIIPKFIPLVYQ